jgi:hypothetical protein
MATWCESCLYEDYDGAEEPCIDCVKDHEKQPTEYFPKRPPKPISNADRIRAMSDEELADLIWIAESDGRAYGPRGKKAWLDWLKQEATE